MCPTSVSYFQYDKVSTQKPKAVLHNVVGIWWLDFLSIVLGQMGEPQLAPGSEVFWFHDSLIFRGWKIWLSGFGGRGMWQVMSMIPGFSQELMPKGREKESSAKIKKFMTMMDSMTDEGPFSFPKTSFVIQLIQDW